MKTAILLWTTKFPKKEGALGRAILCVALAAFVFCSQVSPSEDSPAEEIRRFFELLVGQQVKQAAGKAVFSGDQARAKFIEDWTENARSLSGYILEQWDVEARKGSAEVALQFRNPDENRTLKVGLVKLGGAWKISPEGDSKPKPLASSSPPPIENLEDFVDVTSRTKERRIEVLAENKAPYSLLLRFEADLPPALQPDRDLPLLGILPPGKKPVPLCNFDVVANSSYKYSWRYSVKRADDCGETVKPGALTPIPGVPIADEPKLFMQGKYAYGLPYPAGKSYMIWQGPGGKFSHSESGSRYAVDFSMPLGSEIAAARGGTVVGVIEKNPDNQDETPAPKSMANEVLILHADGTIAVYAHLTTDGAKVSFGQIVRRGEIIGVSGNSGYSRGPHLHFELLGYQIGKSLSVPFVLLSADGTTIPPREGLILMAGQGGAAKITDTESTPWRILHRCSEEYETEVHYFAKTVRFLAANRMDDLLGIELSFSKLDNVAPTENLPRRVGVPADRALHHLLTLQLLHPGEKSSFAYVFRRVEPPGREHMPLRVEREPADGYVVEIRYFSDRIEFYAENKTSHALAGSLDFRTLRNVTPKEKMPKEIRLPADAYGHYLATLHIDHPTEGYSFQYDIGPFDER